MLCPKYNIDGKELRCFVAFQNSKEQINFTFSRRSVLPIEILTHVEKKNELNHYVTVSKLNYLRQIHQNSDPQL